MNATSPVLDIDVAMTIGSLLVAVMFNAFLYGLCFLQFITYFTSGTRDRRAVKLMIAWELFIDTVHTALSVYMLWACVIDNFDNKAYILTNPWHLTFPHALTALSACPIQIFLSLRVKKLSGSWIVFVALVTLTLIEGSLVITASVIYTLAKNWSVAKRYRYIPLVDSSRAVTAATDIAISVCLIYYLRKSRNGLPQTDHLISRFIREAIETGSVGSLFAILIIVTLNFQRHTLQMIYMVFYIPMGRIYTFTFLAILNSRKSLRRDLHGHSYTKSTATQIYGSSSELIHQEPRISQNPSIVRRGTESSGVIGNRITTIDQTAFTEMEELTLSSNAGSSIWNRDITETT